MAEVKEAGYPGQSDFLPYLVNRVVLKLNSDFQVELESFGLTFTQWRVLAFLHEKDELGILALSEATVTDASTLSRALAKMERRGWISRVTATDDRRSAIIRLQRSGREIFQKALVPAMRILDLALIGMSKDDLRRLRRSLTQIETNLDKARVPSSGQRPTKVRIA
jgi:MarR family transcriptional regulator, organic hydroperoxide resistance regulator